MWWVGLHSSPDNFPAAIRRVALDSKNIAAGFGAHSALLAVTILPCSQIVKIDNKAVSSDNVLEALVGGDVPGSQVAYD